jgi:hypothetical protein
MRIVTITVHGLTIGITQPIGSTGPLIYIYIDFGKDEPGMTLQPLDGRLWVGYVVDAEVVKSPVKIDQLPSGRYRLVK